MKGSKKSLSFLNTFPEHSRTPDTETDCQAILGLAFVRKKVAGLESFAIESALTVLESAGLEVEGPIGCDGCWEYHRSELSRFAHMKAEREGSDI